MALLLFFRMMMEADFQLVGKWLKEKQAKKRATKWILISSYECLNQTEEMPSGAGALVRRKDSMARFRSTRVTYISEEASGTSQLVLTESDTIL